MVSEGGELIFAGSGSFSMTGRGSTKPSAFDGVEEKLILGFHRIKSLLNVPICKIITGPIAHHFLAVSAKGDCYIWGRNEEGQLGTGDLVNRYDPTPLKFDNEVVSGGACSASHTIVFTKTGKTFVWGNNKNCELGMGMKPGSTVLVPRENTNIEGVSCCSAGKGFSIFVTTRGETYSCGQGQHGVLGNGDEGKTLEKAGKFTFELTKTPTRIPRLANVDVVAVASGQSHSVAMDFEGKLYSWGFNGYGQLGVGDNKTRLEPTPVEYFHNKSKEKPANIPAFMWRSPPEMRGILDMVDMSSKSGLTCGMDSTYLIANQKFLYKWGITKKTNEATLNPTAYDGLSGWEFGPTSSIAAPESGGLITWGASPTFGELGYGAEGAGKNNSRSSTVTKKVEDLEGAYVKQVVMAAGYSLCIVSKTEGKGASVIEKLPVLEPEIVKMAPPKIAQSKKRKGSKGSKPKAKRKSVS